MQYSELISPLLYYNPAVEKIIFCTENGIPWINFPAPQGGSTAPATFSGEIVQASTKSLSGLVLLQLIKLGAPFIYGAFPTVMDMKTSVFSYGAPEFSLMAAAMSQMAQFYKFPFFGTAGVTDAKFPDDQAAAEGAFSCLSSGLVGAKLIHDAGSWFDHGSLASPTFMILVSEILYMFNQYVCDINMDDECLAIDLVDKIGPGGHYLYEDHTMAPFKDVWYSDLFDRTINDFWLGQRAKIFADRAGENSPPD